MTAHGLSLVRASRSEVIEVERERGLGGEGCENEEGRNLSPFPEADLLRVWEVGEGGGEFRDEGGEKRRSGSLSPMSGEDIETDAAVVIQRRQ